MSRLAIFCTFLCLFLLWSCSDSSSQDTLEKEVIFFQEKLRESPSDSSMFFLSALREKGLGESSSISDSLIAESYYAIGTYFKKGSNLDSASIYFQRALLQSKDSVINFRQLYYANDAWEAFKELGKYGDCISVGNYFLERVDSIEYGYRAWGHYLLAEAYIEIPDNKKALEINDKRIELLIKADNKDALAPALITKGRILFRSGRQDESFRLFDSIAELDQIMTLEYKRGLLGNYGAYLFRAGFYQRSYEKYLLGLQLAQNTGMTLENNKSLAYSYANLAEVSIKLQNYTQARAYLDSVNKVGVHNLEANLRRNVLRYETLLALKNQQSEQVVFDRLDTLKKYQDLTYQDKIQNELVALQEANENEKKLLIQKADADLKNLRLQSTLLIVAVSTALLLSIGLAVYFRRKYRFERNSLQLQQRLLRSQMNPHFAFNTLSVIKSSVKTDPDASSKYLVKFSRLLRSFLENSTDDYIQIGREIASLREYLDLQLLRFPGKFTYRFEFHNMEEDDLLFIPPMLLQPFVENSIEHGFSKIDYPGEIVVSLTLDKNFINCSIDDNGVGVPNEFTSKSYTSSTRLISDFLKKMTKTELTMENKQKSNPEARGTRVRFRIPFNITEHD